MLGKLLKHEFIATARVMWVIYAAMAGLSVFANLSIRGLSRQEPHGVILGLMYLSVILWVMSLVIGFVAVVVLLIKRFHKNLLTDEGYLMFTLPSTVHHLVLSKLIVAAVWIMVTFAADALCVGIGFFRLDIIKEVLEGVEEIMESLTVSFALNGTAMAIELLLLAFVGCALSCLQFYSAMSIGYGFSGHKALWSVVFYFIQVTVLQIISTVIVASLPQTFLHMAAEFVDNMTGVHVSLLGSCLMELILAAVFYFLTVWNLKHRLNLS